MPEIESWRRNLYAVAVAQFIALGGGNLVFPFMPFYVQDLGVTDPDKVALWSGLLGTATGGMLFVSSPIWGSLADRFGRKPLLLRAYLGAMITMTLQGLVQNVWQLFAMRALQGAFVGTIPAATALVASGTPRERVAYALGLLQMALFTSQFVGPLAGGGLAASIGFRPTFLATAGFYLISFLLVLLLVEERFERPPPEERAGLAQNLRLVVTRRPLLVLIAIVFLLNSGPPFVRPIIPLVVESFAPSASVETLAGFAFAAMALTSAGAAIAAPRLSARAGYRNALALMTLGAGAAYLPVAMAANVPALIVLIGVVGLFTGGMLPTANALIDLHAPPGRQASAFGLAGSAMALGFALAPLAGGAVAATAGVDAAFVVIGLATASVGAAIVAFVREPEAGAAREPVREVGG